MIHRAELESKRIELENLKQQALEDDDAKAVNHYNDRLNAIPNMQQSPAVDHSLNDWNAKNPWVGGDTPKAIFARNIYAQGKAQNEQTATILARVDSELNKHYPPVTTSKATQPAAEGGSRAGSHNKVSSVTISDLTSEELGLRSAFPEWQDEKKFLKAVTDARKAK
jgi:hypothetical protein